MALINTVYAAGLAATKNCPSSGKYASGILRGLPCDEPIKDLETVMLFVKNIINDFVLPIVGTLFIIMIIAGGILYISSAGNQQRIDLAKKTLTAAIIGLLIITLAYAIVAVFANLLGGGIR